MAEYGAFFAIAMAVAAMAAWLAWPWLRRPAMRERAAFGALMLALFTLILYLLAGNPFAVGEIDRQQADYRRLEHEADRLQTRLQAEDIPTAADSWAELGMIYLKLQRYPAAREAMRRAVTESGGNPVYIFHYGKAQMLAADGTITEGAKDAFLLAAKLAPENPEPRFFLALERMQAGDHESARAMLEALRLELPENSALGDMVRRQLDAPGG